LILNTKISKGVFALLSIGIALLCIGILLNARLEQRTTAPAAAKESQEDRIALHQALLDLTSPWTVMCIAAHPDDEDGTSLIVMRRKYGAHTVSVFTTFGEGGQNAIGAELYEELGAIRVQETMAASEIQGSEPYFLGLKDFGYSKSADEAFRIWGHDESLRRMVLQIRKLRPDVIITNHDTSRGHGHHQATGQLVLEAFDAAADPKRFPEQLKDSVHTWQVQRLFVRGFGGAAASSSVERPAGQKPDREGGLITIDPNERDPNRGMTYAEQALQALQKHATQGPWPKSITDMARFRNSPDGKLPLIRYRLTRVAKDVATLPNESHNFVDGLRLPENIAKQLELTTNKARSLVESADNRATVLEQLLKGFDSYVLLDQPDDDRFNLMKERVERAIALAAGITLRVEPSTSVATANSALELTAKLSNTGTQSVRVSGCNSDIPSLRVRMNASTVKSGLMSVLLSANGLAPGSVFSRTDRVQIPNNTPVNVPLSSHLYEPSSFGLQVKVRCSIQVANADVNIENKTRIDVAPLVEITELTPSPLVLRFTKSVKPPVMRFKLINHTAAPIKVGILAWSSPRKFAPQNCRYDLGAHAARSVTCAISGLETPVPMSKDALLANFTVNLSVQDLKKQTAIGTGHFQLVWTDAEVPPDVNVGYIRGFDYSLPNALAALGVESKELMLNDVRAGDLQKYSAILVDNRVYESQPELIATNQRLLDYARDGGTLIVFYHKSNEWNPNPRINRPQLAPYPIILNDERVTDENAPVTLIEPQHHLLNFPNKIGQEDFAGWIQERGLYYPKEWDVKYQALLATNDPGEAPLRGGLLVVDYGRGHYVYTSMVWYRELRAGVPGAYRMLANMISYGRAAP